MCHNNHQFTVKCLKNGKVFNSFAKTCIEEKEIRKLRTKSVCCLRMLERRNRKAKLLKFTEYLESWNFPSFKFCLCFLCFCLVEESFYLLYRQDRVMFVVEQVNTKAECEFQDFFCSSLAIIESKVKSQRTNNSAKIMA